LSTSHLLPYTTLFRSLVGKAANHLSHSRQAFALDDLLLQFLFQGNVSHRDDHAIHFIVGIEQRACRCPHGAPASITMPRSILARSEEHTSELQSRFDL